MALYRLTVILDGDILLIRYHEDRVHLRTLASGVVMGVALDNIVKGHVLDDELRLEAENFSDYRMDWEEPGDQRLKFAIVEVQPE